MSRCIDKLLRRLNRAKYKLLNVFKRRKTVEEQEKEFEEERRLKNEYLAAGLGSTIPTYHLGFRPSCVEDYGGAVRVYRECLKRSISWQELCHYDPDEYDPAGCNRQPCQHIRNNPQL